MPILNEKKSTAEIFQSLIPEKIQILTVVHNHHNFKPAEVDLNKLQANGKLHTDEQINYILNLGVGKHKKDNEKKGDYIEKLGDYSVVALLDENQKTSHYSIYPGSIGKGSFGKVRLGQNVVTGEWVALKLQPKSVDSENEFQILQHLKETKGHISRIKFIKDYPLILPESERYYRQHIIALPHVKGMDLSKYLQNSNPEIPPYQWIDYALQLLTTAKECHQRGIFHNDINPKNYKIDPKTGKITLLDFGLALRTTNSVAGPMGSAYTMAPEVLGAARHYNNPPNVTYSEKTEIYQIGKSMALLLGLGEVSSTFKLADYLYDTEGKKISYQERAHLISLSDYTKILSENSDLAINKLKAPSLVKTMLAHIESMCDADPNNRPSMDAIIESIRNIRDVMLSASGVIKKLGILDAAVYTKLDDVEKSQMLETLKNFDEVIIINTERSDNPMDLLTIQRDLEKANIRLLDSNYEIQTEAGKLQLSSMKMANEVAKYINKEESTRLYECYYVAHPSEKDFALDPKGFSAVCRMDSTGNYAEQVQIYQDKHELSLAQLQKIIDALERDVSRMVSKYQGKNENVNDRIAAIRETISHFRENSGTIRSNISEIDTNLKDLQGKMKSTGVFGATFKPSHSASTIEELRTDLSSSRPRK